MNLCVASVYTYIWKSCFINFGDWSRPQHGKPTTSISNHPYSATTWPVSVNKVCPCFNFKGIFSINSTQMETVTLFSYNCNYSASLIMQSQLPKKNAEVMQKKICIMSLNVNSTNNRHFFVYRNGKDKQITNVNPGHFKHIYTVIGCQKHSCWLIKCSVSQVYIMLDHHTAGTVHHNHCINQIEVSITSTNFAKMTLFVYAICSSTDPRCHQSVRCKL